MVCFNESLFLIFCNWALGLVWTILSLGGGRGAKAVALVLCNVGCSGDWK